MHLWSRRGCFAEVRVIRWFLLCKMERKTGNSSAVHQGRVPRENRKFPTDITFTKLVRGSASSQTEETDRGQRWHQGCHWSKAASPQDNQVELCRWRVRLRHCRNPERTGGLCVQCLKKSINHYKIFSWSAASHPLVGQQNSTVSYAEHCRRSRAGNKGLLLSREVVRVHPSLLLPVWFLAWSQTGEFIFVAKFKFSSSIYLNLCSSNHQAQLSQTLQIEWNHPNIKIIKTEMKSICYHWLSVVYNIHDVFYLPMLVTPESYVWYRQRVEFSKVLLMWPGSCQRQTHFS